MRIKPLQQCGRVLVLEAIQHGSERRFTGVMREGACDVQIGRLVLDLLLQRAARELLDLGARGREGIRMLRDRAEDCTCIDTKGHQSNSFTPVTSGASVFAMIGAVYFCVNVSTSPFMMASARPADCGMLAFTSS